MRFRSDYPDLSVQALGVRIVFRNGVYETDDPAEIRVLERVAEVEEAPPVPTQTESAPESHPEPQPYE